MSSTANDVAPEAFAGALVAAVDRRRVKLRQLEASVPVWSLQDGDLRPNALEPYDAVHPITIDRRLAPQLESERGEERHLAREVLDDDADVFHPLARHVLDEGTRLSSSVNCPFGDGPGGSSATSRRPAPPPSGAGSLPAGPASSGKTVPNATAASSRGATIPRVRTGAAPRRRERRVP